MRPKKVFVAMSGGVDSSVAAFLLKKRDYQVTGIFMKCFNIDGCAERDAEDARRVANHLGIPFYVFDFEDEYKKKVVKYMVDGYKSGITPNPDIMCNKTIKFDLFLKEALKMGADYIATGHYIRLWRNFEFPILNFENNSKLNHSKIHSKFKIQNSKLFASLDANKDQSYFLWTLTQDQLKHCLFPMGDYQKSKVREIARKAGLPTAEKKDSQGICFLGKFSLVDFLKTRIPAKTGDILDENGKKIGEHDGVWFYTIGQRHIGLTNRRLTQTERRTTQTKNSKPLYVAAKDIKTNTLIAVEGKNHPLLYKKEIELSNVNFVNPNFLKSLNSSDYTLMARIRYRQTLTKAKIILPRQSASFSASIRVLFETPQKAIAPGQSAVFYRPKFSFLDKGFKKYELLGGGVIT